MIRWPYYESHPLRPLIDHLLQEERRPVGSRGEPMPVNVYEDGGSLVVEATIPGVRPEDVDIQCGEGVVTIRARTTVADRDYIHQEVRPTEYVRQLALPADCRFDAADADVDNGILTIRIPKARARTPEKIRIQVAKREGDSKTIDAKPGSYSEVKPKKAPKPR